jgi:uncharacterized protein
MRPLRTLAALLLALTLPLRGGALPEGVPSSPAEPVTDLAGLLSPKATRALNRALRAQWQAGHFQLGILTLPSLQGRPIEELSIRIARAWALGGAESDNGVLLILAPTERKVRIEVGQKLEGVLSDAFCSRVINEVMKPSLRAGDYDRAVLDAAAVITAQVAPEDPLATRATAIPQRSDRANAGLWGPGLFGFIAAWFLQHPIIVLLAFFGLQLLLRLLLARLGFRPLPRSRHPWGGGTFGSRSGWGGGGYGGGGGGYSGGGASGSW